MKKIYLTLLLACGFSAALFAQAKKPTLMVVPSDNWCVTHGYIQEFNNMGKVQKLPDYRAALQGSSDLLLVISKINELMAERGFPLKNLESVMRSLENQSAEDAMLQSGSGADVNESPIDKLKYVAKADIWIQLTWSINQLPLQRVSITYNLQGLDAYTNMQIAGASGTGAESGNNPLPVLLEEAVLAHMDNFTNQLQNHFDDMFENGRMITLRIMTFSSFDGNLESEYGDKELNEIIEDWVSDNTQEGRFSLSDATENMMLFEQVRIPMLDINSRAQDARGWARGLQKMLKDQYKITSKLMTRGLGQAQIVVGDK